MCVLCSIHSRKPIHWVNWVLFFKIALPHCEDWQLDQNNMLHQHVMDYSKDLKTNCQTAQWVENRGEPLSQVLLRWYWYLLIFPMQHPAFQKSIENVLFHVDTESQGRPQFQHEACLVTLQSKQVSRPLKYPRTWTNVPHISPHVDVKYQRFWVNWGLRCHHGVQTGSMHAM